MLIRGLNVVVLNEVTGVVMSSRWFDTYESDADSGFLIEYLKGLRDGRIVCFAIKVIEFLHIHVLRRRRPKEQYLDHETNGMGLSPRRFSVARNMNLNLILTVT